MHNVKLKNLRASQGDKFCGTVDGHKRRSKVHAVECTLKEGRLEKDSQP